MGAARFIVIAVAFEFLEDAAQFGDGLVVQIDAHVYFRMIELNPRRVSTPSAPDAARLSTPGRRRRARFQRLQQAVSQRRIGCFRKPETMPATVCGPARPFAVGGIVGAHRVAGPLAASRAGVRNDVVSRSMMPNWR